ncbi:MAG TPA: sulfurtransferase complex subunit TusD [Crenotrichaceae bacterium]|nr:sulfurtransferase complex subunit TusD [Crenotrichaceae bacterium]
MVFVIQVNSAPYQCQSAYTALQFSRAVLDNHQIKRIFFYHEGIYNAFVSSQAPADQIDMIAEWSALATDYHVDLLVCISAAQLRGLTQNHHSALLATGFRIGGLGEMVEAMIEADRLMVF